MLQQTEVQKSVYTAFRDSPFALQESVKEVYVKAGSSIQGIIDASVTEEWQHKYLRVVLNDEVINPEDYALTFVNEKDIVGMVLVPQGGEVGQIFKAVAIIAIVIAVTYFTAGALSGPTGAALTAGEMAIASGVGAAAGLAASLALNALFPPPVPSLGSASSGVAEDPVYGFSKTGNSINKYGPIPIVFGCRRLFPQHAIAPYIIAQGTDQYLYQAFTAGYGPLKIDDISIGDNAIGYYKDVEYYIHENFVAGDELKIVKEDNWQDPYSIKLNYGVDNVVSTTDDANKASLAIQFPQGLFWLSSSSGNRNTEIVELDVKIRKSGTATWFPVTNYNAKVTDGRINSTVTSNSWTKVGIAYTTDPNHAVVNELPAPSSVGDSVYRTLASYDGETYTYTDYVSSYTVASATSQLWIAKESSRPFFVNVNVEFPEAGKWEFKVQILSEDREVRTSNPAYDTCFISSVRSIKNTPPLASEKPIALIELKIKATDQLNGSVNNLSCTVTSKLPVWNGSAWVNQATRNPAWAYLDVMRGWAAKNPVPQSRIDMDSFIAWAAWCDQVPSNYVPTPGEPEWQTQVRCCCDMEVTSVTTAWEVLKLIAATGYATPSQNGGKYSITIDQPRTTAVQVFSPKNIKSFSGQMSYHIQPHALRIAYTRTNETETDEVIVYDDGYNADGSGGKTQATIFETMQLVGISRYNQAYTIGRRALAQGHLRIETFTVSCDVENLLATRGSLVRLAHDVPKIGSGTGRIVAVSGGNITIDDDFKLTSGTIYAHVRHLDGTQSVRNLYYVSGRTAVISGSTVSEGDLIVYGELNRVDLECIVKSVHPSNDLTASLELVPYAPGIYTADTATIPARDPWGSNWTGGGSGGPQTGENKTTPGQVKSLAGSYQISYTNKIPNITVNLSWSPPVFGGKAVNYRIWYQDTNGWRQVGETTGLTFIAFNEYTFVDADGNPVDLEGKALKFAVSGLGIDQSFLPPDNASQVTITPSATSPKAAMTLTAVGGFFENVLSWTYQTTGFDVAAVEVWASLNVNNRALAELIAKVTEPASTISHTRLDINDQYYYWIRLVDGNGSYSDWYPESATNGVLCAPSTDPAYLLDILYGQINTDQIADELNERINLIDDPDTVPGSVRALIKTETTNRTNADSALQTQVNTISASTATNAAAIVTEATARANGDSANATSISNVQARLDTGDFAAVKVQSSASASAITGLNAKWGVTVNAGGQVAGIALNSGGSSYSSFTVLANVFNVYSPTDGTPRQMFGVGTVNGITRVGISGDVVIDGSVIARNIGANQVTVPARYLYGSPVGTGSTFTGSFILPDDAYVSVIVSMTLPNDNGVYWNDAFTGFVTGASNAPINYPLTITTRLRIVLDGTEVYAEKPNNGFGFVSSFTASKYISTSGTKSFSLEVYPDGWPNFVNAGLIPRNIVVYILASVR